MQPCIPRANLLCFRSLPIKLLSQLGIHGERPAKWGLTFPTGFASGRSIEEKEEETAEPNTRALYSLLTDSLLKISPTFWQLFPLYKFYITHSKKAGWAMYISGDFFTNSPGHTALRSTYNSSSVQVRSNVKSKAKEKVITKSQAKTVQSVLCRRKYVPCHAHKIFGTIIADTLPGVNSAHILGEFN
jgi:hypothetical protein